MGLAMVYFMYTFITLIKFWQKSRFSIVLAGIFAPHLSTNTTLNFRAIASQCPHVCNTQNLYRVYVSIFTLQYSIRLQWSIHGKYFPVNATGHMTEELVLIFLTFNGLFVTLA